jgi:L-fuculose-phosphate aldolase
MSGEEELRGELVRVAQALDRAGFCPSKSGNVSARWRDGLLITPTGLPYSAMHPDDVVELDLSGAPGPGGREASSEWPLHASIYKARADVRAIVHTHSPLATALSCARRGIPGFHYMIALCGGADIRCADYATFGTQQLADTAVDALENRKAALLANHGVVALGETLEGARVIAAEVENLAGQYLALLSAGLEPTLLGDAEMKRIAEKFAGYGKVG